MNTKVIGKRLIELRGERKREEVAEAIGVSKSAIAMYEAGERVPRDPLKLKIANYYNKTVEEIFFDWISTRNVKNNKKIIHEM